MAINNHSEHMTAPEQQHLQLICFSFAMACVHLHLGWVMYALVNVIARIADDMVKSAAPQVLLQLR
jgi:hypothetical protein